METRLRELEERLKKSEDQRQKLKDNLVRSLIKPSLTRAYEISLVRMS